MGILDRFGDIIKANVNAVLDKMEDPAKMIDQYLRDMMEDLAEVKRETAGVMAEETRTRRQLEDNQKEVARYQELAKKALTAGNEGDARVFLEKKQQLEQQGAALQAAYDMARGNAEKMRQLHDKLTADISQLQTRRQAVKAKVAVARTQEKVNQYSAAGDRAQQAQDAFTRMEQKADAMLDRANAMAELNQPAPDAAAALEEKYSQGSAAVDEELAKLKAELGL